MPSEFVTTSVSLSVPPAVGVGFVLIANFNGTLFKGVPKMSVIKTLNVSNVERIIGIKVCELILAMFAGTPATFSNGPSA